VNTQTLAQLLIDCDYKDDGSAEDSLALAFFVAGAAAAMLMARRGDPAAEILDQIDTLHAMSLRHIDRLEKERKP